MQTRERGTLVGVFADRARADACIEALQQAGFRQDQLLTSRDSTPAAATPKAITTALMDHGVAEEHARSYEREFQAGRILVAVKAADRWEEARSILAEYGAHIEDRSARTAMTGESLTDTGKAVELREEELQARKTPVQTGEVQIHKEVITENRTIEVPVTREEVVIERRPVHRPADNADFAEHDETIRVPVMAEEVTLEKSAIVREELEIGKREVTDRQQVSGEIRKEAARIDHSGEVKNVDDGESVTEAERLRRRRQEEQQRRSA